MKPIVECVPNISEGRDRAVIDAVTGVLAEVEGVRLLDVDPGADTNRTVITFIGPPAGVEEAAVRLVAKAAQLIDMSRHHGAHPRHGATDVVPFVPVAGVTMEDCVAIARRVGRRLGEELGIPVYLYEHAALQPERRNLAHCRQGEYEALPQKLGRPEWRPDFGPDAWSPAVARTGATNVGARQFLVAYNVNLNSRSKKVASDIALDIREAGRARRDAQGNIVKDAAGNNVMVPGTLKAVKAVGWFIPEYDRAQISINLVDISVTQPHHAFDEVVRQAERRGLRVTGSELVGLIPKAALLEAGKYYLEQMNECTGIPEKMIMETAIQSMGLAELAPFDLDKKVIEYAIARRDSLVSMKVDDFLDLLSTDSPAPGGGSVAAICAAISGALSAMVANLTVDKKGYEQVQAKVRELAPLGQDIKERALQCVDKDTDAFNQMMDALRLPKKTEAEIALRDTQVEKTTQAAIMVPYETLEIALEALRLAEQVAEAGNANALSDAGVAALTALSAAKGAHYNILINLAGSNDAAFKADIKARAEQQIAACESLAAKVESAVRQRI